MSGGALGWGGYLPPREVANEELAAPLGSSPGALFAETGVARRRWVAGGVGPSDLGCEAARRALATAGLEPADVDLIVFATMTPDVAFPGSGCYLQHELGCRTVGALDVRAQCAGFLFALATADRFVRAGAAGRVLVVGAEVYSTGLEMSPRGAAVTPRFGDGGGAVVIGGQGAPGVLAAALHSDPDGLERFWCEYPSSRHYPSRMNPEAFRAGLHYARVDADALHAQAERALGDVTREALGQAGVPLGRIALYVVHYLDPRVARRAADALGVPPERVVATAEAAGHMGAGGIPVAVVDAIERGRIGSGDVVACAAFGAGMSWAGAVLRL